MNAAARSTPVPRWPAGAGLPELRALLARGGVLAIPTESSYGLGADPRSARGVEAIYSIKRREPRKPLPVVAADARQLAELGLDVASARVRRLLALGPAALTAVLPLRAPLAAGGDSGTLAVRIPASDVLRQLLLAVGPLTATSANVAGEASILDPAELTALLEGFDAAIVDAGRLPGGPPSTLINLIDDVQPRILRAGAFPPLAAAEWFAGADAEKSAGAVENISENA